MYEQPAGVRANMKDSLSSLAVRPTRAQPTEKARVYLLLSFLHAVVQERLRYVPNLGWKGFWEFNDSDYECSAHIIDTWIDRSAMGRTNIAPNKLPWEMIRTLITETYGGKIDDESDFSKLRSLVHFFFTPDAFNSDFKLVDSDVNPLYAPEGIGMPEFMQWVNALPEREPPTYLGLPANAEKLLLVDHGKVMIRNLETVTGMLEETETLGDGAAANAA